MALLLTSVGCRSASEPGVCERTTRVTGQSADHGDWTTLVSGAADEPPRIGDGYVLVRHDCGYAVLDLEDGREVKTGEETGAVGVADRFLYLVTPDGNGANIVESVPVVGDSVDNVVSTITSPCYEEVSAYLEHGYLYIATRNSLERTTTDVARKVRRPHERWEASLPILDGPTFTPVGDVLVVTSRDGSVYGLDMADLQVHWRTTVPSVSRDYVLSVEARDGLAIVTARPSVDPPTIVRIRASDGKVLGVAPAPAVESVEIPLVDSGEGWEVTLHPAPPPPEEY